MKKIIFTAFCSLCFLMTFAQIKVFTGGETKIGGNSAVSPVTGVQLEIDGGHVVLPNNRLGIGLNNPVRSLHIRDNLGSVALERDAPAPGFLMTRYTSGFGGIMKTFGFFADAIGSNNGYFSISDFGAAVGGVSTRRLTVDNDGSVIIGPATSSGWKLYVSGDAFKTSGGSNWNVISDERTKSKVNDFKDGLNLVKQIQTVEYEYNGIAGTKKGQKQIGVIAQELQKIAPFMVSEFAHQESDGLQYEKTGASPSETKTYLSMNPSAVKWILVNAVQEQQKMIDNQSQRIADLEKKLESLVSSDLEIQNSTNITLSSDHEAWVVQNVPNPSKDFTRISYSLPNEYASAEILVYNLSGQLIKSVILSHVGQGQLNIDTANLPSGTYTYSLLIDENLVDTKKMIINK